MTSISNLARLSAAFAVAIAAVAIPLPAQAATITVTTTADVVDPGDGLISLREAVDLANSTAGNDEIVLGTGTYTLTVGPVNDNLNASGDLDHTDIAGNLSIVGAGQGLTTINTTLNDRVLHVQQGSLRLTDLTISDGARATGAGVYVQRGGLDATNVTFDNNKTTGSRHGGGARIRGDVDLTNVLFTDNEARRGGAFFKNGGGTTTITESTFVANSARSDGGAIFGRSMTVTGSTFSANTAARHGGAISSLATNITNSTVDGNSANNRGGGIYIRSGNLTAQHSTITANSATAQGANVRAASFQATSNIVALGSGTNDCWVSATSTGGNFFGDASCGGGGTDLVDAGDPMLNALANNGGPTQTRLPSGTSSVIDFAPVTTTVDQRGIARPNGVSSDTGAVEARQPVATDDGSSTDEDTAVAIDVATNDTDPDGLLNPADVVATTSPGNGTTVDNGDGTITYTPDPNWNGTDSFDYSNGYSTATVTLTVDPVNDDPTPVDDVDTTPEDVATTTDVLGNDTDVDGDSLSVSGIVGPAANGSTVINADHSITYTPDPDWNGIDTYTYEVTDGNGGTATAAVMITVSSVNDAPRIKSGAVLEITVDEDDTITFDPEVWFEDPEGDIISATAVSEPSHGTAVLGSVIYTPDADYFGSDGFDVTITDSNGASIVAEVAVTVNPVDDPPVVADETFLVVSGETVSIDVLANDFDPEGDPLSLSLVTVSEGTASVIDGEIQFTSAADFEGTVTIVYGVTANGVTVNGTLTLNVQDGLPLTGLSLNQLAAIAAFMLSLGGFVVVASARHSALRGA